MTIPPNDDELDDIDYEEYDDDFADGNQAGGDPIDELAGFVDFMVSNLVDDIEGYQIVPEQLGTTVHIKVLVPEDEMGRVIGRQGRIARSMRTLLTIAAARRGMRASLDIDS